MMDERTDARTDGRTEGRTWATLNALPHSTNGGGIKRLDQSGKSRGRFMISLSGLTLLKMV